MITTGRGGLAEIEICKDLLKSHPKIEKLYWSHRKIDLWSPDTKTIGSIKSIDPRAASYANEPAAFKRQIKKYLIDIGNWDDPVVNGKFKIDPHRQLRLAVPES